MKSPFSNLELPSGITTVFYNGTVQKNKNFACIIANEYGLDMYYLTLYQFVGGSLESFKARMQDCIKNYDKSSNLIYIDKAEVLFRSTFDEYLPDPDIEEKVDILTCYLKNAIPPIILNLRTYPQGHNTYIERLNIASEIDTDDVIIPTN